MTTENHEELSSGILFVFKWNSRSGKITMKGDGRVKKLTLTRQDIQKELLAKLNKAKGVAMLLTVIIIVSLIIYPIHLVNYLDGTILDYPRGSELSNYISQVVIFLMPVLILFFIIVVLHIYYIDLYNIKKGNFRVTEDKLCQKEKELRRYYKHTENENALYFPCGRVSVEKEVYSYSNIGDEFFVVMLKFKRNPQLVYHGKYYEINLG